MKKYWVYVHTCPNGKRYVGCTTRVKPEYRWVEGNGYQYNKHFYSAILKYGWDNITHDVFEVDSAEEMYRKEIELISFYHSNDPEYGYNNSTGGEHGSLGCKHSEEARKKKSEARKGKACSEETKKKIAEANKERVKDPEFRRKLSEAHKKKWLDPEYRKKISEAMKKKPAWNKGKTLSEEHKRHMSEAVKNRPKIKIKLPDGTILEMSKSHIIRHYVNKGRKFEYVS